MSFALKQVFASALLMAAACAETKYYEAYAAPIVVNEVPSKVAKISIGLDDSEVADRWIIQDVTAVYENIVSGEVFDN